MDVIIASIVTTFVIAYAWFYFRATDQDITDRLDYYFRDLNEDDLDDRTNEWVEKYVNNIPEYTEKQRNKDNLGFLLLFFIIVNLIWYF